MRKVKRRREEFILFDYQGVEKHLEKMAAKGWQLVGIENGSWIYHRSAPAQLQYSITYIPTASEYDPTETESKNRLDEYCEMVGWIKVTDWLQMQIYCTDNPDTVPIETDEEVRLNVIRKSMRKTFLISHILMAIVFALNTFSQFLLYKNSPVSFLSQNKTLLLMLIIISGLLFVFVSLAYYAVWVVISKKSVASGGKCARVRGYRQWAFISLAWILVLGALFLLSMSKRFALIALAGIIGFFLVRYLVQKTREVLRNKGVDKYMNMVLTLVVDLVLVIALVGGITWVGTNGLSALLL